MTVLMPRVQRRSRYLFEYSAKYCVERGVEEAITGQAATFTRASIASAIGSDGVLHRVAHSQPRYEWVDLDGDGIRETPCRLLEDTRENICLQSENFGTTWTPFGTPTRTPAAHTASGVALDLIGDDSTGGFELYHQEITFTGDAVKAVSFFVKKGPSPAPSGSVVALQDADAPANRFDCVITWDGSVPSVITGTGTYLGYEVFADGVYRLLFVSTAVTAANTNDLNFRPAGQEVETGNIYVGGVQVENATFPSSYVKTTTAAITRASDSLTFPFLVLPREMTVYLDAVWRVTPNVATNYSGFVVGDVAGSQAYLQGRMNGTAVTPHTQHSPDGGGTIASADVAVAVSYGDRAETRHVLRVDGATLVGLSLNGAAEIASGFSTPVVLDTSWGAATLGIGLGFGQPGYLAVRSVRIAAGIRTLDYMRAG